MIEDILGDDWILVDRLTRQYIEGKYYDYPIKILNAFKNIGLKRAILMAISYMAALMKYRLLKKEITNFEEYIVANFGRRLGEFSMLNYSQKIWGTDCKKLHIDWAGQRIKGLNLFSALIKAISINKKQTPKTLIDQFYYPLRGTGTIYETIADKINKRGSEVYLNSRPTRIYHNGKRINNVDININNKVVNRALDNLVTSIPITTFIDLLDPAPDKEVQNAINKLKWRSQVYLFITLDKKSISKDNWIYFPNLEIPFGRISEMKNFSKDMCPEDKTIVVVEYFVWKDDFIWHMSKEELTELTLKHTEQAGLFGRKDIRNVYHRKNHFVYPVYDLDYNNNLHTIKKYLDKFENLEYIGRPGRFFYTNQDHSLEMGIMAARSIMENKHYDLEKIGTDQEYFENGYIKNEEKDGYTRQIFVKKDLIQDIENIVNGTFSPLKGFLRKDDFWSVANDMRLSDVPLGVYLLPLRSVGKPMMSLRVRMKSSW